MRIYEVRKNGQTVSFARSFDVARAVVREDDPSARKTPQSIHGVELFTNGMSIIAVEIKPDKEGIISKLNSLLEEKPSQSSQSDPEPVQQPVAVEATTPIGISPAIEFTGKGKGTCLHCSKTVGYVGGFPRVNPPAEIRD